MTNRDIRISTFDEWKYSGILAGKTRSYIQGKSKCPVDSSLVNSVKTEFSAVGRPSDVGKFANFLQGVAGFFARVFIPNFILRRQFDRQFLGKHGAGSSKIFPRIVAVADLKARAASVADAVADAIGPNGCFTVTRKKEESDSKGIVNAGEGYGDSYAELTPDDRASVIKFLTGKVDFAPKGRNPSAFLAEFLGAAIGGNGGEELFRVEPKEIQAGQSDENSTEREVTDFIGETVEMCKNMHRRMEQQSAINDSVTATVAFLRDSDRIRSAVGELYVSLKGSLEPSVYSEEKFYDAFLWNVAYCATKGQVRVTPEENRNVDICFTGMAEGYELFSFREIRTHRIFRGILKPAPADGSEDVSNAGQPMAKLLSVCEEIEVFTAQKPTAESVQKMIAKIEVTDPLFGDGSSFSSKWNEIEGIDTLLFSHGNGSKEAKALRKEDALKIIIEDIKKIISEDWESIQYAMVGFGKISAMQGDGSAQDAFNEAIKDTGLYGAMCVPENANMEMVLKALGFLGETLTALKGKVIDATIAYPCHICAAERLDNQQARKLRRSRWGNWLRPKVTSNVSAFDGGKFASIAGDQTKEYIEKKVEKRSLSLLDEASEKQLAFDVKTNFFDAGNLSPWGKIKNFFAWCVGFVVRVFTSKESLKIQFDEKCLRRSGPYHTSLAGAVDNAEVLYHARKLVDDINRAIGPNGYAIVTKNNTPYDKLTDDDSERIIHALADESIVADQPTLVEVLNSAIGGRQFKSKARSSVNSKQPPAVEVPGESSAAPAIAADGFAELLRNTFYLIGLINGKTMQRRVVEAETGRIFGVLISDKSILTAIDALHAHLASIEPSPLITGDGEEFRRAFLRNVVHVAVKSSARSSCTEGCVEVNFPSSQDLCFSSSLHRLLFRDIFKSDSEISDRAFNEPLSNAITAIKDATVDLAGAMGMFKIGDEILPRNNSFEESWRYRKLDNKLKLKDGGEVLTMGRAFEIVRKLALNAILDDGGTGSVQSSIIFPMDLCEGREDVQSRFAKTVEQTPIGGLFSVVEGATEYNVNRILGLLHETYSSLQMHAKTNAANKFKFELPDGAVFSSTDLKGLEKKRRKGEVDGEQ
ncbi:MAG: hypothetical protein LBS68_03025 [Puniceicoccales bacterium]|jgi:hypothetical protein|nr:hypothetical protein [Puniceicoccales bacterium]